MNTSFKCICCGKEVKKLYPEHHNDDKPWEGMWDDGIVERVSAGYGSLLDGDMYVLAICDKCTDQKAEEGTLVWVGNYMDKTQATRNKLK